MGDLARFGRLGSVKLNELQALTIVAAIRREMARLEGLADVCRARGDRDAWALFNVQRCSLLPLKSEVLGILGGHDTPSGQCMEALDMEVQRIKARMPAPVVQVEAQPLPVVPRETPTASKRRRGRQKNERIDHAAVLAMHAARQPPSAIQRRHRISEARLQQIVGRDVMRPKVPAEAPQVTGKPPIDRDAVRAMAAAGARPVDVQRACGISPTHFYRIVGRPGESHTETVPPRPPKKA